MLAQYTVCALQYVDPHTTDCDHSETVVPKLWKYARRHWIWVSKKLQHWVWVSKKLRHWVWVSKKLQHWVWVSKKPRHWVWVSKKLRHWVWVSKKLRHWVWVSKKLRHWVWVSKKLRHWVWETGLKGEPNFLAIRTAVSTCNFEQNADQATRESVAKFMCHSLDTQERFYALYKTVHRAQEMRQCFIALSCLNKATPVPSGPLTAEKRSPRCGGGCLGQGKESKTHAPRAM
uniref:Uncharacterized protein n=1 Tax=Knipowitschia caucasica TaxID=637954 RepID=A0AAV2LHF0_KNICA